MPVVAMMNVARKQGLVITIDGPAGVGKSTTAFALASRLGYAYFDTGALYRAIAWAVHRAGIDCSDAAAMASLLASMDMQVFLEGGVTRIVINNEDVTSQLRSPDISRLASAVAMLPSVRQRLLPIQQQYGRVGGIVVEGRDMGTRVFPDADAKFFLDADLDTRTARRYREMVRAGYPDQPGEIQRHIQERDRNDRARHIAPLKPADDAVRIDSSSLTVDQVVENMMDLLPGRS